MKKFSKIVLGVLVAGMAALPMRAQVVYECDFEDPTEVNQWVLNAGNRASQCLCQWMVGKPGNFSQQGQQGLFVSSDSANATYVSTQAFNVVSYRAMTLPVGQYYLDFDWRSMGGSLQYVGVAWVPQTQATNSNPTGVGAPAWFTNANGKTFRGSKAWTSAHMTLNVTQASTTGKLVFIWISGLDNSKPKNPSGCVDNIVIRNIPASSCSKPTNLTYSSQTAKLSWNSSATLFQVRDYCVNDGNLVEYDSVASKSLNLQLQTEGTHIFYVRSVCDEGNYSEWVSISTFLWIPGMRCIEYLDIGNAAHAGVCYTGLFDDFIKNGRQGTMRASADTDPSSDASMHVIHTDINELDPQTINSDGSGGLPTVPEGEIAAVRLGAYTSSGQSAAIEYKYLVQQGMSDLLDLNYAVVMESGGHGEDYRYDQDQQPTFQLFVLDGQGQLLESSCTHLNIKCGFGDTQSWHWVDNASPTQSGAVCYSDWQKVTVSLRPYVGQTLTIRLLSSRCSYDTHPAHAYFSMSCRSGDLQGLACGDFSTDHFDAPEGFNYRWYKETDLSRTTISTDRTLHIANDDSLIYMVECHSLVDNGCYFTLTANPNPRFPMAIGDTMVTSTNCRNTVLFTNQSVVRVVNRKSGATMSEDEPIYTCVYDYGDGVVEELTALAVKHVYPDTGGTYHAMMIASMNEGICQDTLFYDITLPDLIHTGVTDTIIACQGDSVLLPLGTWVKEDTVYVYYTENEYGCEAPNELHVIFHKTYADTINATLCKGGYVEFEGTQYTQAGDYRKELKTQYGCDSVLLLHIEAADEIKPIIVVDTVNEEREFATIHLVGGTGYNRVSFEGKETTDTVWTNLGSGNYEMIFYSDYPDVTCELDTIIAIGKGCLHNMVFQRWNDVLSLKNTENNGGLQFLKYQWYKNDQIIPEATHSYYYAEQGLEEGGKYQAMVQYIDVDGQTKEDITCPFYVKLKKNASVSVNPTALRSGETFMVNVPEPAQVQICDMLGRTLRREMLPQGSNTMSAPAAIGLYVVNVHSGDITRSYRISVGE